MLASIARSSGEKPPSASSVLSASARSSRIEPRAPEADRGLQPLEPVVRARPPSPLAGSVGLGRRFGALAAMLALCSWSRDPPLSGGIGIGDAEIGQYSGFQPFHHRRLAIVLVVVADKMKKSVNDQMGKVIGRTSTPALWPLRRSRLRARTMSPSSGPETAALRRCRRETRGRWSGCPCRGSAG